MAGMKPVWERCIPLGCGCPTRLGHSRDLGTVIPCHPRESGEQAGIQVSWERASRTTFAKSLVQSSFRALVHPYPTFIPHTGMTTPDARRHS